MRRAGLGEAGEERTFGETLTCTPKKSTALKIERLDLEGHLQGRGHRVRGRHLKVAASATNASSRHSPLCKAGKLFSRNEFRGGEKNCC